jgi:hypothetical protein
MSFLIDSIEQKSWPGFIDWSKEVFPVTAGIHTFTWKYDKIVPAIVDTADCVWIDYISFPDFQLVPSTIDKSLVNENNLTIFPNPNDGTFNLLFGQNNPDYIDIEVFDIHGQLIFSERLSGLTKNSIEKINLEKISKGIYIVRVCGERSISTRKIIVQ